MADVLELLCRKFSRDRQINLTPLADNMLSGEKADLKVNFVDIGTARVLGVEKTGESILALAYTSSNSDDRIAVVRINSSCLTDYLTLLLKAKSNFAGEVRERFESYLSKTTEEQMITEEFVGANVVDALSVLDAFYPKQK